MIKLKSNLVLKNEPEKKLNKDALPYLFLVLGFIGSPLVTEAVNILHEFAKDIGEWFFIAYGCFIVLVACPWFLKKTIEAIEVIYAEK